MMEKHRTGISSYAYCFACGSRPLMAPDRIMTPLDLIDRAADLGADAAQIGDNMPIEGCSDEELENIRAHAGSRGIVLEAGMRMATPGRLRAYIDITRKIGGSFLRVITDGPGFEPGLQECCRIFSSVIPLLEESGVTLGIENHDRFKARDYALMAKTVGHPKVALTVDTVNSMSQEESAMEVARHMAPYCACMHIKDYDIQRTNNRCGLKITGACPGTGRLDIQSCYEECRSRSPYDFSLILEAWMEPCATLEETLRMEDEWTAAGIALLKSL